MSSTSVSSGISLDEDLGVEYIKVKCIKTTVLVKYMLKLRVNLKGVAHL